MPERILLDINRAAERLGRDPSFLRRLVTQRQIRFYKVGRLLRFDVADLDELIDSSCVEPWAGDSLRDSQT